MTRAARRPYRGASREGLRVAASSARTGGGRRVEVAGVTLSHPDRVFYPDDGITKLDLARYYEAIAAHVVPHVRGRPLTLVRCPSTIDECAYMRHAKVWGPSPLRRVTIPEKEKLGEYLVAEDLAGVIALVQMDVLEIHTWSSTVAALERPDRLVFDLDPDEELAWAKVAEAARHLRARLEALGLRAFVKTTGGKGLHVVVPLAPELGWDACFAFARALAQSLALDDPATFTTQVAKAKRRGRIFVDYLRNNRGNTSVAAFSVRARPGAPVSVPIGWHELGRPPRFDVRNVPRRLARLRQDPWAGYAAAARQRLGPSLLRALGPDLSHRSPS